MRKNLALVLFLLMSALFLAPLKLPTCPFQSAPAALSIAITPCSAQQIMSNSCFSASYWFQEEFNTKYLNVIANLIGLLGFLIIFSKYISPQDEIYRPPIKSLI
ncbi:Uncharacterised protein [Legionella wadsworthii]|uniref:Transmembrane protein n=1 Tax=Legionella wadsworthii TaxID=28088 RepID=A0A378LRF9_9GAMM|nr:hypothetical protein [Legionella wadsworthii]STY29535.1 Uncharacterised protein [Legionella wadsworthii]